MKEIILQTKITEFAADELPEDFRKLADTALRAAETAYYRYSHFQVGAAVLLANGEVICGSNQENAAYPSGLCAAGPPAVRRHYRASSDHHLRKRRPRLSRRSCHVLLEPVLG